MKKVFINANKMNLNSHLFVGSFFVLGFNLMCDHGNTLSMHSHWCSTLARSKVKLTQWPINTFYSIVIYYHLFIFYSPFLFILTCFSLSFTRFHRFISFLLFLVWVRLISVNQWFCVRCIETEAEPFQVTFVFCGHF